MTGIPAAILPRKMRLLVFCRPYLMHDFQENTRAVAEAYDIRFLTDGQYAGVDDTRERFYARLDTAAAPRQFTSEDERDVLERCRYLRNMPYLRAVQMLRAMASVLDEELEAFRPSVVLSHMVDDYVTHLLAELARRRGIVYVGYAYSYFPNKIQVTQYGNGVPFNGREPSDDEVQQALQQISVRTFRQNYLQPETYTKLSHLKSMLRYQVKRIVFAYRAWREKDPLQTHYGCLPFVAERRHWRDFPSALDFHGDWRQRLHASGGPIVYLPLGYFPEATIDYWIEDRRVLDYQNFVLNVCRVLGGRFRLVVKEHLHMLGARSPDFYRALRDTPGVISVPPLEFSNDVVSASDIVLMGAGSIGVESFIRGKPIVSFCARSYWFGPARAVYIDPAHLESWPLHLEETLRTYVPPQREELIEFIRACLRSTMRELRPGRRWPICDPSDLRSALQTAMLARVVPEQ